MAQTTGNVFQAEYGNFINGKWEQAKSGKPIDMYNPATGEVLSRIQASAEEDVLHAVRSAHDAFPKWSQTTPGERQKILLEMAKRVRNRIDDYALMETLNNGKPIVESKYFDMPLVIDTFDLFAGAGFTLHGMVLDYPDAINVIHREPYGVCAQIIPWNVPMIMMANKIAPAIVSGNTVVLKPAETVCLSILEFFKEMSDIIPPGVINVITGYGPDIGPHLVSHPLVSKVAFTGSGGTGRKIIEYTSKNIIPSTMELGGKSANIVFSDADIDAAVEGAAMSLVLNKGEICLAGSRLFLQEGIKEEFLHKLKNVISGIVIGDPTNPQTQLGPQASVAQYEKVKSYLNLGPQEGAEVYCGGAPAKIKGFEKGNFIKPTIFTKVDNKMRIAQEEIFGPVTCVMTFKDVDEAIRLANDTAYGLGGGVWTRDISMAHSVVRKMQTGTVWINRYYNFKLNSPIGGYKQSGYGVEFCQEMVKHYTRTKSVIINLNEGPLGAFAR